MSGTIRTYDQGVREKLREDLILSAEKIAESAGATAEVSIEPMYSTTINDEELAERMAPVLERAADGKVATAELPGAAEDFSFLDRKSTRLNSSHVAISYAVFCLKKKKKNTAARRMH